MQDNLLFVTGDNGHTLAFKACLVGEALRGRNGDILRISAHIEAEFGRVRRSCRTVLQDGGRLDKAVRLEGQLS